MQEADGARASGLDHIAVLIPAWQPGPRLLELVSELRTFPFAAVLVVDDGSTAAAQPVFDSLRASGVAVVHHAVNLGKGRALKTGFNALLEGFPGVHGVVTADADGQHTPQDIRCVAEALAASPTRSVVGARAFSGAVPRRSRFGNALTRLIFSAVADMRLHDTQSGLRGLPVATLPALMALEGERYEYEMTMLVHLCRNGPRPIEVPIQTVYLDGNRGTHFHPLCDSMRIAFVLLRLYLSPHRKIQDE